MGPHASSMQISSTSDAMSVHFAGILLTRAASRTIVEQCILALFEWMCMSTTHQILKMSGTVECVDLAAHCKQSCATWAPAWGHHSRMCTRSAYKATAGQSPRAARSRLQCFLWAEQVGSSSHVTSKPSAHNTFRMDNFALSHGLMSLVHGAGF